MRVSVVIPLHNKKDTVGRAIRSVLAQETPVDNLVIVDDGSTDNSMEAAKIEIAAVNKKNTVIFLEQNNLGVSVARNAGANATNSDLIAFLDADDEWLPEHITEILRLAKEVPSAGLLSTRSSFPVNDTHIRPARSILPNGFFGEVKNGVKVYSRGYGVLHTSSIAVTRKAWRQSKGFLRGAKKSQDILLWLQLLQNEIFAHSGKCTAIRHTESSGIKLRSGAVPAHLEFFFGSSEGRQMLADKNLKRFLVKNLLVQIITHRVIKYDSACHVVGKLQSLSSFLGPVDRGKVVILNYIPIVVIKLLVYCRSVAQRGALKNPQRPDHRA